MQLKNFNKVGDTSLGRDRRRIGTGTWEITRRRDLEDGREGKKTLAPPTKTNSLHPNKFRRRSRAAAGSKFFLLSAQTENVKRCAKP